jgi:hypothetical protein
MRKRLGCSECAPLPGSLGARNRLGRDDIMRALLLGKQARRAVLLAPRFSIFPLHARVLHLLVAIDTASCDTPGRERGGRAVVACKHLAVTR